MKVIIYGNSPVVTRIKELLVARKAEVLNVTGDVKIVTALGNLDEIKLAVIDDAMPQAENVYEYLKESYDIPVVLVMGRGDREWQRPSSRDADGFICRAAGQTELVARLDAILRRINKSQIMTARMEK